MSKGEEQNLATQMSILARGVKSRMDADAEYERIKKEIRAAAEKGLTRLHVSIRYSDFTRKLIDGFLFDDGFRIEGVLGTNGMDIVIKW